MRNPVRLIVLLMLGIPLARADAPAMSGYMECARAIGVAINEQFTIVPGELSGDKGLFLYTNRSAYFVPRGAPRVGEGESHEYFLKTSISGIGDLYLDFRERKPGRGPGSLSAIGYQTTPPRNNLGSYRAAPALAAHGDQARQALSRALRDKIVTVKDFIDDKNSFSTPEAAKVAFERDRVVYRNKLETCRIEGDRDLKLAVAEELKKLESGFPGTTIWEMQIGGKPPPIGASKKVSALF